MLVSRIRKREKSHTWASAPAVPSPAVPAPAAITGHGAAGVVAVAAGVIVVVV
jgi:hypothetical protein